MDKHQISLVTASAVPTLALISTCAGEAQVPAEQSIKVKSPSTVSWNTTLQSAAPVAQDIELYSLTSADALSSRVVSASVVEQLAAEQSTKWTSSESSSQYTTLQSAAPPVQSIELVLNVPDAPISAFKTVADEVVHSSLAEVQSKNTWSGPAVPILSP